MAKLKTLNETVWYHRAEEPVIAEWIENFAVPNPPFPEERLHALFMLSNFMYYGNREIRELLKALYRDLYRYPIVEAIRKANGDTTDSRLIDPLFIKELVATRFLGLGNPAESGCHLLYYFRQENGLPTNLFIHTHQIFSRQSRGGLSQLRDSMVTRYIFIDDLCGSGKQGVDYSNEIVEEIKRLKPDAFVGYYTLFATSRGISKVRNETKFDTAMAVYELDESFRCFSPDSRYFRAIPPEIDRNFCEQMFRRYGEGMVPAEHALGYRDSQLLIGFHHNTPDNTLPVIWFEQPDLSKWKPIFRRYPKLEW